MTAPIHVFAIAGSLRAGSFNCKTLATAVELAPQDMTFDVYGRLGEIPLYNEDVRERGFPPAVEDLSARIRAADALLFVTPEYNYSLPGVLKNAIDWASRPPDQPFAGKPGAIMSASIGMVGGGRAQYHLRQVFVALNVLLLNKPEITIPAAHTKFDEAGHLTDEATRTLIARQLEALADWTRTVKS